MALNIAPTPFFFELEDLSMLGFNLWSDASTAVSPSRRAGGNRNGVLKESNSPLKGDVRGQSSPTKKSLIQSSPAQKIASPQISQRFDRPVVHRNIMARNSPLPKPGAGQAGQGVDHGSAKPRTPMKLSRAAMTVAANGFDASTLDAMTTDLLNRSFGRDEEKEKAPAIFSPTPPQREGPFNLLGREKTRETAREKEKEAQILANIQEMKQLKKK